MRLIDRILNESKNQINSSLHASSKEKINKEWGIDLSDISNKRGR